MSILNNSLLLGAPAAAAGGISRSLRFNSSDSAYLSRTPASAGNRKTWTWAGWVKRAKLGTNQVLFSGSQDGSNTTRFQFTTSDTLQLLSGTGPSIIIDLRTTQVFRDCSAWGHIVVSVDTTQTSGSGQIKIYYNGVQITAFGTATYPTQNYDTWINSANTQQIGSELNSFGWLDAYLADVYLIDGQALTPSSLTETDQTTGQLIPKAYTGSYGTNGFHLEFADNSAATATTLGKDTSGLGNNWTPNNLSVTAGAGNDSLVDVPTTSGTDNGNGGEIRGNYCTWNPLAGMVNHTLANGNLDGSKVSVAGYAARTLIGTIGVSSGKWYWEITTSNYGGSPYPCVGFTNRAWSPDVSYYNGYNTNGWGYGPDGNKQYNATGTAYGATWTSGDVIGVALDLDNGTATFYKNGISQGTAFTGLTSGPYYPALGDGGSTQSFLSSANFGQRPFAYTAPSGFKALCTANLPAPLVTKPSSVFDAVTYNGSSGTKTITMPGGFSPDLVWIKNRGQARWHSVFDQVRGAYRRLFTNATNAEANDVGFNLDSFTSTGFTLLDTDRDTNSSAGDAYVAWCWDAGSSTVTNTAGSITGGAQVRANTTAGFSVVTYTGSGALATVGHGLGIAPAFYVIKRRDTSSEWTCYHSALGATKYITLQSTAAAVTTANAWNNTAPTSSVFTINNVYGDLNANGGTYVAYCFAPVVGYSSFGSYTGNGSTDGPFVYTGFRPAFVMMKMSSSISHWWMNDNKRTGAYNVADGLLFPNLSSAESTFATMDFLSNGFKLRAASSDINTSSATYIYAAFAESPFNYARAR